MSEQRNGYPQETPRTYSRKQPRSGSVCSYHSYPRGRVWENIFDFGDKFNPEMPCPCGQRPQRWPSQESWGGPISRAQPSSLQADREHQPSSCGGHAALCFFSRWLGHREWVRKRLQLSKPGSALPRCAGSERGPCPGTLQPRNPGNSLNVKALRCSHTRAPSTPAPPTGPEHACPCLEPCQATDSGFCGCALSGLC